MPRRQDREPEVDGREDSVRSARVTASTRSPAIEGWFTLDDAEPRLLGSRCVACGTYFFPQTKGFCRNPDCEGAEFEQVPLSRAGRIWSYTNACYQPPEPFVAPDPFVPFAIAAVELEKEKMIVLGQVVAGVDVDELAVGMPVELVLETLYREGEEDKLIWKWRPLAGAKQTTGTTAAGARR
jgi:uncharacterized OB-fold protein